LVNIKIQNYIFLTDLKKNLKYKISWKSVYWKPGSSKRTDGRTERQTDIWRS